MVMPPLTLNLSHTARRRWHVLDTLPRKMPRLEFSQTIIRNTGLHKVTFDRINRCASIVQHIQKIFHLRGSLLVASNSGSTRKSTSVFSTRVDADYAMLTSSHRVVSHMNH